MNRHLGDTTNMQTKMSSEYKVRYKLPWPGLGSIPIFYIDNNDIVYSLENRLPPSRKQFKALQFQYVRLFDILDMAPDDLNRMKITMVMNQLIADFGLSSMRTIACFKATPFGQHVVVDQYLPLTTLLASLVVCPSKTFDKFRAHLLDVLDTFKDLPCMNCGVIHRNCTCGDHDVAEDPSEQLAIGYATSYKEVSIQTEESGAGKSDSPTDFPKDLSNAEVPPEDQAKIITGPGGMKVMLPSGMKLNPGSRLPLTMSQGPTGPCLIPTVNAPHAQLPNMGGYPHGNFMHNQHGYLPGMPPPPPPPHNLPPYSMDPSVLMPPPPLPPPIMPPSYLMPPPPHPPLPPNMHPMPPTTLQYQQNNTYSGVGKYTPAITAHSKDVLQYPGKFNEAGKGYIDITLPERCNPNFINTRVGSFKKITPVRNVSIQVDTVVLPKKKTKEDPKVTHIYSGIHNLSKSDKKCKKLQAVIVPQTVVPPRTILPNEKCEVEDVESPARDKLNDPQLADLDEETAKLMDEDTLEMLKKLEKQDKLKAVVPKKLDKVWRMIIDDDSDEDEKTKEADGEKQGEGSTGNVEDENLTETSPQIANEADKHDEEKKSDVSETISDEAQGSIDASVSPAKSESPTTAANTEHKEEVDEEVSGETRKEDVTDADTSGGDSMDTSLTKDTTEEESINISQDAGATEAQGEEADDLAEGPINSEDREVSQILSEMSRGKIEKEPQPKEKPEQPDNVDEDPNEKSLKGKKSPSADEPGSNKPVTCQSTMETDTSDDLDRTDDVETRPSSATEELNVVDAEEERRSMAAEVLGSLARLAPLVPSESTVDQDKAETTAGDELETEQKLDLMPDGVKAKDDSQTDSKPEIGKDHQEIDKKSVEDLSSPIKLDPELLNNNSELNDSKLVIDEADSEDKPEVEEEDGSEEKKDITDFIPKSPPPFVGTANVDGQKKYFAKFEHLPTGEKLYRCTYPTCSQCFDARSAAKLHNQTHTREEKVRRLLCLKCDYKVPFFKWFDLLRHLRETHKIGLTENPNGCMFCGLLFESQDTLSRHMEFHYSSRYKCVHCGLMMMSWGQVKLHMDTCPEKEQTKVNFGCPYCMFVFHKRTIRNIHMLSHSDKGLQCALCEDNSTKWEHWKMLRKHYQTRHAKVLMSKIGPFRQNLPQKKRSPKCHICSSEFKGNDVFNTHMLKVHDLVPYTLFGCNSCDKTFRTRRRLDWHVKSSHEEEVACEECDFIAKNKTILRMHMTQKHCEKQHMCTECGKSFVYFHQLRVHMAHHARKIVHTCRTCAQEFTRSAELRKHVHDEHSDPGERKAHYCTHCQYWTYTRSTLQSHIEKKHAEQEHDEDSDGPSAPAEVPPGTVQPDTHKTMYPQSPPPYPSVNRPRTTPTDKVSPKRKKRKRLTMPARRPSAQRASKTSEATVIKPVRDKRELMTLHKPVRDRKERKRIRDEEEEIKKVKKLRRSSCARTRSVDEQKAIQGEEDYDIYEGMTIAAKDGVHPGYNRKMSRSGSRDESLIVNITYPYIDHNYYKLETQAEFVMPRFPANMSRKRSRYDVHARGHASSQDEDVLSMNIVSTPSVSGFEVCETSPKHPSYRGRKSGTSPGGPPQSKAARPGTSPENMLPLSSPSQITHSKIQSPVQIRSLLSRALQASPTKANRSRVSSLSQQLKSLAMEPPSLEIKDLDFSELMNEAGEILPEQDLITDILNSMDNFNLPGAGPSNTSPKFGETSYSDSGKSGVLSETEQESGALFPQGQTRVLDLPLTVADTSTDTIDSVSQMKISEEDTVEVVAGQKGQIGHSSVDSSFDDTILQDAILQGTPVGVNNEGATDIDEIELKEADYQLWHDSPHSDVREEPLREFDNLEGAQIIVEFRDSDETESVGSPEPVQEASPQKHDGKSNKQNLEARAWMLDHQYF